ncbi:hypothetical protein D3C87_1949160 [compost metagenome]
MGGIGRQQHQHIDVSINIAVAFRAQPVEDLGATDGLVWRFGQNFQKCEFGTCQRSAAIGQADRLSGIEINRPVAEEQCRPAVVALTVLFLL